VLHRVFQPASCDAVLRSPFVSLAASELRHPNIVLLMGACLQPPNLFIVMEWSEGGSLFSLLHQSSRAFDLRAVVRTAIGIARALLFMHSARPALIHRDIKSHNVIAVFGQAGECLTAFHAGADGLLALNCQAV
jgi:serine/threonine protein kinase